MQKTSQMKNDEIKPYCVKQMNNKVEGGPGRVDGGGGCMCILKCERQCVNNLPACPLWRILSVWKQRTQAANKYMLNIPKDLHSFCNSRASRYLTWGGGAQDIWIELDIPEVLFWALHGSNILKIYQGYNLVF